MAGVRQLRDRQLRCYRRRDFGVLRLVEAVDDNTGVGRRHHRRCWGWWLSLIWTQGWTSTTLQASKGVSDARILRILLNFIFDSIITGPNRYSNTTA